MAISVGTAILGTALLGAGVSAITGSQEAKAAKRAAGVQAAGAERAREDLAPFAGAGVNALNEQLALLGLGPEGGADALNALTSSPGFQFRLGQGVDALDRSAAARGGLFGGNQGRAVTEFGQNFASNEFANRLAQLGLLAGRGQSAAAGQGAAGIQGANATAGGIVASRNALSAGGIGAANAVTGGIENFLTQRNTNKFLEALG